MSAILVRPLAFTAVSGNANTLNPVHYLNLDQPGLVWRSANLTTVHCIVDLGTAASYDTVALVGSNLRSTDTVRVQTGTSNTGTGSYDSGSLTAWSGTKDDATTAKTVIQLPATRTERYMRIDVTATSHPAGYVEAQRLVVGKKVSTAGIDQSAELSFEDQSVIESGPGFVTVEEFNVLPVWKVKMSWISDTQWREEFWPLFTRVGLKKGLLFVPKVDQPTQWQHEAVFGRITTIAKGEHNAHDNWVVSLQITGIAP